VGIPRPNASTIAANGYDSEKIDFVDGALPFQEITTVMAFGRTRQLTLTALYNGGDRSRMLKSPERLISSLSLPDDQQTSQPNSRISANLSVTVQRQPRDGAELRHARW
jgi:hypothetical protein